MTRKRSAVEISTLPNGLRVVTRMMPERSSVALGFWVATGSRHESLRENGSAHFIEHMLFKGTLKRSPKEISQAVEGLGGYLNAFTGEESTCYYARARYDHLDRLFDVLSDMTLNSRFDPADFQKEREVIKEEVSMYLDQPQHHVQELLNEVSWPDHPLGRPLAGTHKTLDTLKREDLLGFQKRCYTSGSILVAAAGNVDHAAVVQSLERIARKFNPSPAPKFEPVRPVQPGPQIRFLTKKTEQCQLAFGFKSFARNDPRRYALRLLNVALGENMSSRLFQTIREDRGLAYAVSSSVNTFQDTGSFVITAGLDEANLSKAVRLILAEIRGICSHPIPRAELQRARDYAVGQFELGLESTENQMNWIAEQVLAYDRIQPERTTISRLSRVSAAEIQAVARDLFQAAHARLAVISPAKQPATLKRMLAKL